MFEAAGKSEATSIWVLSALYLALQKTGAFKSFSEEGFEGPKVLQLSSALSHHLPRTSD